MEVKERKSRRHDADSGRQARPHSDDDNIPTNEQLAHADRAPNAAREAWNKSPQRAYAVDSKPTKSIHGPEDAEMDESLPLHERNEEE